jgi:uncharacterized protein YdaU (DUF1376 family)
MHYYQHHIGDFIKDTSFLTNEEVGIYLKLLWLYYDTEKPLPNSMSELSMKVNARSQQDALQSILGMFFDLQGDEWHHKRCDREIEHYRQQLESASKAGKASAAKRAINRRSTTVQQTFNECSTTVQPTNNQQPITNNQSNKPKSNGIVVAKPEGVSETLWQSYKALRKQKKAPLTVIAFDGIKREAELANISIADALRISCERGWVGFNAKWLDKDKNPTLSTNLDAAAGRGGI